jgi:hypothetical protein
VAARRLCLTRCTLSPTLNGKMARTRQLILLFLKTVGRPARTSEIRKAVLEQYPEAAIYSCISDMQANGQTKRLTFETRCTVRTGRTRNEAAPVSRCGVADRFCALSVLMIGITVTRDGICGCLNSSPAACVGCSPATRRTTSRRTSSIRRTAPRPEDTSGD